MRKHLVYSIVPSNKPYHHPFSPPKKKRNLSHAPKKTTHTKSTKLSFLVANQKKQNIPKGPWPGGWVSCPPVVHLPARWPLRSASRMWNPWAAQRCRFVVFPGMRMRIGGKPFKVWGLVVDFVGLFMFCRIIIDICKHRYRNIYIFRIRSKIDSTIY